MYNPVELIIKKRSGHELNSEELSFMVNNFLEYKIPDYQMSAFLMAIYFHGMSRQEIVDLTRIYLDSGVRIEFDKGLKTCDKHSTGGVGDKITMTLAPVVVACGVFNPMISGRGLGHTGGTLDKLESIPGFETFMSNETFRETVIHDRLAIIAQSSSLVPADKMIYALRDVTGTVESLPLITASIMSKKIAEGAQNLVIDLKVGSGAFMKTMEEAEKLASLLKYTGESFGQKVSVIFTQMNAPLGYAIGNALEIKESIEYLKGKNIPDLDAITKALAIEMLLQTGIASEEQEALEKIKGVLKNGQALNEFRKLIFRQKGDPRVCDDQSLLPQTKYVLPIVSTRQGYIESINSQKIGYALIKIGAGRMNLDTPLDMGAGAYIYKKIGEYLADKELIGEVHTNDQQLGAQVVNDILAAISLKDTCDFFPLPIILQKLK